MRCNCRCWRFVWHADGARMTESLRADGHSPQRSPHNAPAAGHRPLLTPPSLLLLRLAAAGAPQARRRPGRVSVSLPPPGGATVATCKRERGAGVGGGVGRVDAPAAGAPGNDNAVKETASSELSSNILQRFTFLISPALHLAYEGGRCSAANDGGDRLLATEQGGGCVHPPWLQGQRRAVPGGEGATGWGATLGGAWLASACSSPAARGPERCCGRWGKGGQCVPPESRDLETCIERWIIGTSGWLGGGRFVVANRGGGWNGGGSSAVVVAVRCAARGETWGKGAARAFPASSPPWRGPTAASPLPLSVRPTRQVRVYAYDPVSGGDHGGQHQQRRLSQPSLLREG